jgi:hypothetical protein
MSRRMCWICTFLHLAAPEPRSRIAERTNVPEMPEGAGVSGTFLIRHKRTVAYVLR